MKSFWVAIFALLFVATQTDAQIHKKPTRSKNVARRTVVAKPKDALQTFTSNVISEVRVLGKDSLLVRVEFEKYEAARSRSGWLDTRHEAFVEATDTIWQQLFYAGATDTVRVDGVGKNQNAWENFALSGVRPEAYAQYAWGRHRIAKILSPITGADFRGVLVARVTFRKAKNPAIPPTKEEVANLDGRVTKLESKPPERTKNFWEYFGVGGGYIARAGGSHPHGLNCFIYVSGPPSLEIGWMGWGAYQGGHTGYLMAGFPVSGSDYQGVEITATLLVSDIIREGKDLYLPPYRNTLLPGIGPGLKLKFKAGPVPFFLSAAALYQPQMYQYEHKTEFPVHAVSAFMKLSVPLGGFYED